MKQTLHVHQWLLLATASLVASWSTIPLQAQTPRPYTNIVAHSFDDFLSPAAFNADSAIGVHDWNTENAGGGAPGSGSLQCTVNWVDTAGGWQEAQFSNDDPIGTWPGRPLAPYYMVEYDVKVLSGNMGTAGTYGQAQIVCQGWDGAGKNSGASWVPLGVVNLTNSGTWQHITQLLTPFQNYNLNKMVVNFVGQTVTNTIVYLVDNIQFSLPTGPAPTLSLTPESASGGLTILTAGTAFSRENIRTVGTNFGWYGAGSPVTYSFTISGNPPEPYTNYQTHFWLVVNPPAASTTFPDYSAANVLRLDINNVAGGAGTGTLRYKTNSPSSNGGYYTSVTNGGGQYNSVPSTSVVGTWSLTFNQNTNVTVTGPDGTFSNYVLAAESAAYFNATNIRAYVGAQANVATNSGQAVVLSSVNFTGTGGNLSDSFPGPDLNTNLWEKSATTPANIFILPSDVAYGLSWGHPDNLFQLATSTDVQKLTNSTLSKVVTAEDSSVIVPKNYPGTTQGFFALVNRTPTKLQVLLPGESAAPGTPSGKTGTPSAQTVSNAFQVVVNAVDDDWNTAFLSDEVYLESPGDTNFTFGFVEELVHGTATYTVTNGMAGSWTIRAVDTTDTNNIAEYVTGSYTVNP